MSRSSRNMSRSSRNMSRSSRNRKRSSRNRKRSSRNRKRSSRNRKRSRRSSSYLILLPGTRSLTSFTLSNTWEKEISAPVPGQNEVTSFLNMSEHF